MLSQLQVFGNVTSFRPTAFACGFDSARMLLSELILFQIVHALRSQAPFISLRERTDQLRSLIHSLRSFTRVPFSSFEAVFRSSFFDWPR